MRRLRLAAAVVVTAVVVAAGWPVYVDPRTDAVTASDPADAVVALGGDWRTAPAALRMVQEGEARRAVLSDPYWGGLVWCSIRPLPADRTCFVPSPSTTRGEAQEIEKLARQNHWDDVVVIAPRYHLSRARYIVGRCYTGRLRMVPVAEPTPVWAYVYQYVYQSAGFVRAFTQRGC